MLAVMIAAISLFIEARFGGPVMLYALVIGALFNPLASKPYLATGLTVSAETILKIGVALLAVKITVIDVANLGWQAAGLVIACVLSTLVLGVAIARLFGLKVDHSILTAGSVAICGSSAALALASVLPQNKKTECNTIVTVIAVTSLSTLAMVLYPVITTLLGFSDRQSGLFMGVSIHNVAQVVGAGYIVSDPAGDIATIVKLMRVACLVPVIIIVSLMFKQTGKGVANTKKPPLLPLFMVAFILIMLINSAGFIPTQVSQGLNILSQWALVIAVAALGVKTSVKDIVGVGMRPLLVLVSQSTVLAIFALIAISVFMAS
ncbi:phosphoenolpyruvate carboxylase [Algimonas arctica]|uniref:Phosphoenolpyruvate carboxylase n=2 Tax=Algimonas arctica TaxID=1479486 RepID=A0A8J3CR23_9PROT|nr:phosphoenolpyruvate carboxylase [Algimonas arctica]